MEFIYGFLKLAGSASVSANSLHSALEESFTAVIRIHFPHQQSTLVAVILLSVGWVTAEWTLCDELVYEGQQGD